MPKIVKANGKTFTFDDNVTNDQISSTIDEYFGVKKKEVSQPASQKTQSASKSKPTTTPISSATEETQVPVESDGLDGPPKMKTFTGFTPEEQKTLQAKPAIKVSKSSELIGKRLKLQKELSTTKVTPENQDEISRKTDELSAVIKAQDEITNSRLSEIENQFKQAKNEDAVKLEADKRLEDLLTTTGVWNNIKSTSLNIYNNLIDQAASITDEPGIKEFKADIDPLSEEKKEVKKDAASRKVKLSDEQVDELAKQLYKDKQIDYIETDNINSFLDNLDEGDKNLLKQSRKQTAEHLQESNLKEEKVINAYEVIGNKKIKEYKDLENQILNYKKSGMEVPKELANSYTSLAQEIIGIGSNIQKRQSIINKNKSDLGTAQQEFDLLKRQYGDVENFLLNTGIAARELGVGVISGLDYLGSMANPAAKLSSMQLQSKLAGVNKGLEEERSNLRKSVESVESPEGFLNYVSDVMSNQIPNLVVTSTGVGGLATIGLSGTGQKYASMNREVLEGKASYTPLQMASAPLLYGSAEVVSEIPTLSILKKGGRVFESIAKNEGDLIKKTAQQKAKEWAKDWGVDMSKELAGEEFTNFAQNFNDKFVLGKKDVGLLDNTGTVFKDTFTLTSILKAAPHVAGAILKPLQTNKDLNVLDENSRKIIQFSKQLEDESLTDVEKSVIKKQIDKATVENSTILANTIEKVNNMPDDVYKKIIDLNNKAAEIKTDAFDINNGTLPNKKELINDLQQEYKTIQEERNSLIDAKYQPTEEVVAEEIVKPTTEAISPETSSNYANLTENKDGDFVFFHVGGKGYDKIKKSTGGTIATSKEEAGALSKVGGVAMYYTSPEDTERMVNGEAKYAVTIPKEKVYDANTDPNNYAEQAKTLHEQENPGKAFDANTKAAYITKIAGENGYDMVVSEWMGKTRAQTTKEFAPTDVELKEGSTIVKPFEEQYIGNTKKGFKSIIPESKEAKLKAVYDEINTEKNRANEYDQLYRLAGQDNSKTPQEDITKLIEEDKTLSQEVKDKYAEALAYKPEQRRTELPVETQFQAHKKNGGSTFLANGENKAGSDASSVSIFTERSKIIDGEITEKDINDFKEANKDLFKGNEDILAVGTWYDSKSGKTYIDVSAVVPNEQAIKLGKQYNQKAVYNLKTNEEVDTGGTGEAIEGLKPEIERVNDIREILKPTVAKSKLEAFKAKYINKPVYDRSKLDTQVDNAKKSLSKILPDVKFVVHDTKESFIKEAGKNGRGYYDPATKTIHINALEANARTVAHEVFHSVLLDKVKTDANARDLTKRMISSISKTLEGNPELKKNLDDFIKNYDENIQSEEKVAELFGYLAEGYEGFDAPTKSIIKRAMDRLAKMFGLKPFTEGEIVDMLKTLSGKVATGEEIVAKDVEIIKEQKAVKDAIKKFQADFIDPKSKVEFVYDKNTEKFKKLEEEGYITKDMSIEDFNGQTIFLHQPDAAFSGIIYKDGELLVEGKGGVYYPIKFHEDGYFWASTDTTAENMAKDLNKVYDANNGKILMALTTAPYTKLLSSTTAANGVMEIILSKSFDKNFSINKEQIKKSLIDAANKVVVKKSLIKDKKTKQPILDEKGNKQYKEKIFGLGLKLKKGITLEEAKSEIKNKLNPEKSSFDDRKIFSEGLISNIADIVKQNPKAVDQFGKFFSEGIKNKSFKGVTKTGKLSISAANMTQAISEMLTEPMLKERVDRERGGQVYAILELNGKVKDIPSNKHESYPKAIQSVDSNNKVKLHILTDRVQWSDVFEDPTTGNIVTKERQLNIFPTSGVSTQGLVLNTNKGRMQESESYSDMKDIVQDMIDDGMTITEIKKTISSELGYDQVSLAERAYNELTTVKEEVVATNDVEAFRDKVKELPQSGIVGKYLSGETIERVEGEAPRNAQDTEVMSLIDAGTHGKETVAMAKEVYGDKYIEKTLEFLDTANLKAHEKAVLYVSLENEMFDRVNAEPDNVGLKKLQDLVRAKSQQFLRESSLAINAGRLRAIMKDGFNYETVTDKFLSSDQLKDKRAIEKAIQSDANAIQKEYESIVAESDLEQMILSGVEKQVNEIYKKLPTARRAKADKAIAALEKIQNKLRGKAYDATVGIPIAIIDSGITIIKNSIKAGVSIADAIEIGINHIKEKYGNNWANEDMFRKDMTEGFKTEGITEKEIKAKELSKKELVKQALIDAGFGKEITVRTKEGKVKRDVLDWKKLAGEEGSVDKLRENVEKIIGKDAAKELEDEYNNLRASIIEKSLNELENRNTPRKKVDLKTSAKKLSELYNYGLFEKESDTYDHLINTALGMNQLDQKSFDEAKKLAKSLSELFSQKDSKGNPISQESLKHAERVLNKKIENLLSSVAWSQSNGAYKAIVVAKEFIGLAQRNALVSVAQAIENTTSGYISRVFKKIGFMFDNVDTKELKKSRNKLAQMTFKDITMNAGLEFGDVTSPFITKSKTMDLIVNASDSRLYHALTSTALGKPFLESADSMHKAALAQGFFHYNLIKILRKKGFSKSEAKNYVSEQLTGQSFKDALVTSKQIIDKINENAGKKVISDSKENVYRFANDLVNEALIQGNNITLQELEAALKSAETVAGFELGHEPNNIISKPLNLFNSWVQTRTDKAVKEKKWNDAAALTAASIVTTNILNPYVGGGTNWTLLAAQKAGIPTLSTIYWNIKSRGSKLDLSTEEGIKNLEKDLKYQLLAKNANARMFIGAAVTLAAFALAKATGADDDLYEWLKKNKWANKYMKKMNPPAVQFMLAQKDKKLGEFLGQQMNIKADAFDEGKKLQRALKSAASGKTQKALGGAGQLIGSRLSTPIIPWRVVRDVRDIYRGLNGLPPVEFDYKASGFGSGYFQGGMIEQIGLRPEDVNDRERESSGNRGASGNRK